MKEALRILPNVTSLKLKLLSSAVVVPTMKAESLAGKNNDICVG